MSHEKPTGGALFTPPIAFLSCLFMISAYFLILRYINGIGYVSNLTDHHAWGVWKVLGVLVGAALVNGGYITAFVVYILNKGQYHRFVRMAVLFSLLGYSFAGASLAYDVGRYVGLLNFFIPKYWQPNSVLFEVAICIMAYIVILAIEFLPSILEKLMPEGSSSKNLAGNIHRFLNKILFFTVAFGVLLPTMHQSGLGGLAVLFGQKLSPLWQSPFISLLYLISSIYMGLCVVVAVECWVLGEKGLKNKDHINLLGNLIKIARIVAIVYVLFRWFEVIRGGGTGKAFEFGIDAASFWLEWILILIGIYFISKKQSQTNPKMIFISAVFMLAGGLLYRINTYIIGFHPAPGVTYFPSFPELMISVGMFALQLIIFITLIKIFPVLTKE